MSEETAAAVLVKAMFDNSEALRNLMAKAQISKSPDSAAEFIKPYYEAMASMVKKGH